MDGVNEYGFIVGTVVIGGRANVEGSAGTLLDRSRARRKEIRMEKINLSTDYPKVDR